MIVNGKHYVTVWLDNGTVKMINQHKIPESFEIAEFSDYMRTADAIKTMVTRGAGAIGASAGYAMAQAFLAGEDIEKARAEIEATRPTAVDLFVAVKMVFEAGEKGGAEGAVSAAEKYAKDNISAGEKIGKFGAELIKDGARVLTHCNAGWLAFVDWGSALAPIYAAKRAGKKVFVWVDETRPRLQGARLTAWELANEGVEHAVIADNAAGYFMRKGEVDLCIVGADRVAANGDVANKIGTYEKAVLARENGVPFYVAIPTTTIDFNTPTGDDIKIEERAESEVLEVEGRRVANATSRARNPAFDVTPAEYVTGFITEKGIIKADGKAIKGLV
ncbi:S-methyl-5-thioribose-1-phosphate isomerase [Candidatus Micrarchaeota archaeon]|nr:S-methyl-5-thioribose-1-phosphate isomerase [Candidatus Micrarchaeota archaeon]MBU1939827.1 S-methyl-5-thioribose-1-phosphate isomerase [Candidatus Micrarchaeota archaeon]